MKAVAVRASSMRQLGEFQGKQGNYIKKSNRIGYCTHLFCIKGPLGSR
jgi:hypothetical protein